MLRLYTSLAFLACILFSMNAFAQPAITAAVHQPIPGDSAFRTTMNVPGFVPGPPGPSQTFSYSAAGSSGNFELGLFSADTGVAPWSYNIRSDYDDGGIGYVEFFRSTPDSLAYSGFDKYIADLTPVERHNPSIKFPFPFNFSDSFHDTHSGQHQSIGGPIPFTGTVDVEADAWGTLVLGLDTIPNVLRVHTLDTMRENFFGNIIVIAQECYEYFADNMKFAALSACTDPQNGNYAFYSNLRSMMPTVICNCYLDHSRLYPNPFHERLNLSAREAGTLKLYDMRGRRLAEIQYEQGSAEFAFDGLVAGTYLAVIEEAGGVQRRILIKQ